MTAEILASLDVPFDVSELLCFSLSNPFTQALANSSCNNFFEAYKADDTTGRIRVRREGKNTCWSLLPSEWREYFAAVEDPDQRDRILEQLSTGNEPGPSALALPSSLQAYLDACKSLSFKRTCSIEPILAYPRTRTRTPRAPPTSEVSAPHPALAHLKGKAKAHHTNALKAGQSPKKHHEVVQFCSLVQSMLDEERCSHCVDVGSGRAHLSRALASPPLDLHVLALDWSSSQKSGAEKLDQIRTKAELNPTVGSLTHRVSSLDAAGVSRVLQEWPPSSPGSQGDEERSSRDPALLVALHACGDLTPDSIQAFTEFSTDQTTLSSLSSRPRAVFVGCCYNLQTPERFPLSRSIEQVLPTIELDPHPVSLAHLRLTPQSPPTWHLTAAASTAFRSATSKLAYRSRLEAELEWNGFGTQIGERKVGRIPDCRDWAEYRTKAMGRIETRGGDSPVVVVAPCRFGVDEEEDDDDAEECEWQRGLWWLRVWWTIRSWLGPPLESLVVLDRFLLLVEGLTDPTRSAAGSEEGRRRVEMVNLFDQATGSLRNIALVVR
ncbi:uncharacterized protein JCM15063_004737 [Sporobolomyces koalae]|uniref:uncharacterized protein n=1 Tax=Sporobolomyces koalae TaxID=500713 RepID=UPI0031720B33